MRIFILFFLMGFFFFPVKFISANDHGTVIMYHRFDEPNLPSTNISLKTFKSHLTYLREHNYNILPLSKLIEFFNNEKNLPKKSVFITIDDGYKSFYDKAFPILLEFDFHSVFLYLLTT